MKKLICAGITAAAALFIAGCSTTAPVEISDNTNTAITASGGTLRLSFSNGDAVEALAKKINGSSDVVEHLWLTIKAVDLHTSGNSEESGWRTVATPGAKFDFLELVNGLTAPLGLHALPAGHYTQIRLILESEAAEGEETAPNTIVINGEIAPLTIPSAYNTGIKCVRSFFIKEGEVTEICLIFNVLNDVQYSAGNGYMMHPSYRTYKCDGSDEDVEVDTGDDDDTDDTDDDTSDYDDYYYDYYYDYYADDTEG